MTRHSHRLSSRSPARQPPTAPPAPHDSLDTTSIFGCPSEAERIAARLLEGRIVAGRHREPKPITIRKFSWEDDNE